MKTYIKHFIPAATLLLGMGMTSCVKDLDVEPLDPNVSTEYTPIGLYNKCYANFAMEGNAGGGSTDIVASDAGTTGLLRQMFNANELPTDEAICGWGDPGIATFINNGYGADHPMLEMYYNRLYVGIDYCNQYINVAADYDATMTAEVRLLRAIEYYLLMDAFGNIPFGTELAKPERYTREQMYAWLEEEVLDIEPALMDAKAKKSNDADYGRLDKAAAWMLLARLYLNAEVYTGEAKWDEAATYAKKVMESSYKLNTTSVGGWSAYQMLFMGDNGETDAALEAIFPVKTDGLTTTQYGASFFYIASTFGGEMHANPADPDATNGTSGAWSGNRARADLVLKFFPQAANDETKAPNVQSYDMTVAANDDRALFCGVDHTLNATDPADFKTGFGVAKFNNFKTDGSAGHDATYPDTDFFLFRTAEAYLTYAEALFRQGKTDEALTIINELRDRAHASAMPSLTLKDICDEWSREFYFEGRRRTDLIRFGYFGGRNGYTWQWKGGVYSGTNFEEWRNIFAIPTKDLTANKNLTQNTGY